MPTFALGFLAEVSPMQGSCSRSSGFVRRDRTFVITYLPFGNPEPLQLLTKLHDELYRAHEMTGRRVDFKEHYTGESPNRRGCLLPPILSPKGRRFHVTDLMRPSLKGWPLLPSEIELSTRNS